jgi:hypothetical protein
MSLQFPNMDGPRTTTRNDAADVTLRDFSGSNRLSLIPIDQTAHPISRWKSFLQPTLHDRIAKRACIGLHMYVLDKRGLIREAYGSNDSTDICTRILDTR